MLHILPKYYSFISVCQTTFTKATCLGGKMPGEKIYANQFSEGERFEVSVNSAKQGMRN